MGYSWDIHGVFICVGYVSGMYRVCIGNVSGTGRSKREAREAREHTKMPRAFAGTPLRR